MRLKTKELVMISAPVLLLIGLGISFRRPAAPLVVENVKVIHVPKGSCTFFYAPNIRTKVVLVVHYNNPSLYKHYVVGLHGYELSGNGYLVDEHGRKYTRFPLFEGMMNGTRPRLESYVGHQRYAVSFPVPLSHIPKAAGKLMLKAKLIVNHKWSLPISVVVRSR